MVIKSPPIRDLNLPQTLLDWFQTISRDSQKGFTGTFTNGDGDTVTVENGKITDVS